MTAILNQIAEKWYGWELAMLWQVGILIAIVAVIELLTRRWVWPQVRYALWFLILVKLVLPPSLVSPMSFTAEIPFMVKQVLTDPEHKIQNTELRIQNTVSSGQILNSKSELSKTEIQNKPQAVEVTRISAAPAAVLLSWKSYIFFVWMAGVAILSGWLVARLRSLRREHLQDQSKLPERLEDLLVSTAHKLGLKRVPQIILTNKVCCPAVFGVFRPVLLMPADKLGDLTREDAEHIFLHELAHIKRGDLLAHAVYMILQIAYWFNPLVWLIRKPIQNLRELCCDATVARMLREKTAGYRKTLLETARQLLAQPVDPGLGLLGLFENSSWLVDRLHWLEKKSWKYRPLRIATIFVLICVMSACVLPMAKFEASADFVIKGTVTDAQTGKPIAGAKVGDVERYAEGKQCTTTNEDGEYSYKTWYEEHAVKCEADGYKKQVEGLLTKFIGSEKEKVINFALLAAADPAPTSEPKPSEAESKPVPADEITRLAQIRNMMVTLTGIFNAATSNNSPESAAKIMEETLPQFEKFESTVKETNYSDSVHMIVEQIRQIIKANKDSARVKTLLLVSSNAWYELEGTVESDYKDALGAKWLQGVQKGRSESQKPAGQDAVKTGENSQKSTGQTEEPITDNAKEMMVEMHVADKGKSKEKDKFKKTEELSAPFAEGSTLVAEITNGTITVTGSDVSECKVIANIKAEGIDKEDEEAVKQAKVNLVNEGGKLIVETDLADGLEKKVEVSLNITIPRNANLECNVDEGGIAISNIKGSLEAEVKEGSLSAANMEFIEKCSVNVGDGKINFEQIRGNVHYELGVNNGKVKFAYAEDAGEVGHTEINVVNGKIDFGSPANMDAKIEANVDIGKIRTSLPLMVKNENEGASLDGTLGSGKGHVELSVKAGTIKINAQDNRTKSGNSQKSAGQNEKQQNVDVYIADFNISPYEAGGLYTVTAKIGNRGTATAPAFRMNFFRGDPKDNLNLHGKAQTGSHGAGPIKPGEFWNESSMPFSLEQGVNELSIVLDTDNSIAETNELNSSAKIKILFENGKIISKTVGQNKADNEAKKVSGSSAADKNANATRSLKINIYEGNNAEPQTSVRIPLLAMKIVKQLLPPKDKLQIIAQKIKLDESLPGDMNSTMLIEMLEDMLKKLDQGVESTTLLEVKDGGERIIISLE